jgi:zinc protease
VTRRVTAAPAPGAIRPFHAPALRRTRLANDVVVLAAEHGELPLVTAAVVLDAGGAGEGRDAAGLATLTVNAVDAGTRQRSAAELAEAFERIGAQLNASATWDAAVVDVTVAAARLEPALELLAEVVREPSFPAQEVERARGEQLAEVMQRRTEPRALASDMAMRFIFADTSPYARPLLGARRDVERLTADATRTFHVRRFVPHGSAVLVVGALEHTDTTALVERFFGDWQGEPPDATPLHVETGTAATTIYIVDRPGSVQSEVRVGHVGVERSHPDYFALEVMNSLLGGAFTSRLNMSLRERHGFTYGARSGFVYRRQPGPFIIQTAVATDVTAPAVAEILAELRGLRDGGATEPETAAARDFVAGVVPLQLQTTEQIASRLSEIFIHDLGDDYLAHFQAGIRAVTVDDVNAAARRHLDVDRLAIVIVGDAAAIEAPLAALGVGPVRHVPAED